MSTPTNDKSATEQQVPTVDDKQNTSVSEEKAPATESSTETKPSAMEVESSQTDTKPEVASSDEKKPEAASSEETKPADANATSEESKSAKPTENKRKQLRGIGARKRFKWLLEQGYSQDEAFELAKKRLEKGELLDRYLADKGRKPMNPKVIDAEVKKLNPADKKLYTYLLQSGHSEEEALQALKKKRKTTAAPNRQANSGGGAQNKMTKSTPNDSSGIVMVVAAKDYPAKTLTNAQSNEVKAAILKEVVQQKDSETKPRFESCTHVKAGYLRVNCSDGNTRQWLHKIVGKLTVPEGVPLKLLSEKNLIKGDVYTGVFADSKKEDNAAILEFINSQNDGLDTSKWKVLSRKEVPNKQSVEMIFSVDQASSKTIATLENELNYKFNKVQLRKQVNPNNPPQQANRNNAGRTGGRMGPPQRRMQNQVMPRQMNSIVPVWDNNQRQQNNFNQFSNGNNFGNGLNLSSSNGNNGFGMASNLFGGNNFFGSSSNSNGGSNNYGNNQQYRGNNSFGNSSRNSSGRSGNNSSMQSNTRNRPFNLSESLYDQLKLIGNSVGNGNGGANYGSPQRRNAGGSGQMRRTGGGGNNNSSQGGRNSGGNSNSFNRGNVMGKRNFFTTTRTGFF
ncbi:heterogeneous nuclear ribonucleoprotein A1-like [Armigeres subalbatus]|uniref:heterogeneous nuclear ribonucleoprotein A1-like n=1 Tax=Armigeres subalbatus TaxID=124917 RepID=UPI002ED1A4DE